MHISVRDVSGDGMDRRAKRRQHDTFEIWTKSISAQTHTEPIRFISSPEMWIGKKDNDKKKSTLLCIHITFNFVIFPTQLHFISSVFSIRNLYVACSSLSLLVCLIWMWMCLCQQSFCREKDEEIETRLASFWLRNCSGSISYYTSEICSISISVR